jgi:hypothetical protein
MPASTLDPEPTPVALEPVALASIEPDPASLAAAWCGAGWPPQAAATAMAKPIPSDRASARAMAPLSGVHRMALKA